MIKGMGLVKIWHENGQLQSEGNYKYGGEGDYEFGRRDGFYGLHKEWDENGKLIKEVTYSNGWKTKEQKWIVADWDNNQNILKKLIIKKVKERGMDYIKSGMKTNNCVKKVIIKKE